MSGAAVRISPLGRWTESAMVVNRTSALIDTRGTIPAPRSLGNTFGVEFGVVQRGDGLLEDAGAAECCGLARHRSFCGNPGLHVSRPFGGSCPRSGDQDGAGPRRRKTGPTLSWAPAIGAMAERVSWTEPPWCIPEGGLTRRPPARAGARGVGSQYPAASSARLPPSSFQRQSSPPDQSQRARPAAHPAP